jgi:predicted PurR-regulated permease PerM
MTNIQRVWALAVTAIMLLLFFILEPILMPFIVGIMLAYLGDPLADLLENRGFSRTSSVTVVFLGLTLFLTLVLLLSIPLIGRQLDLLALKIPQWLHAIQNIFIPWLQQRLDLPQDSLPLTQFKTVISNNWMTAGGLLGAVWAKIAGSSMAMIAGLANLVLIPVVTFYLLRDWDVLTAKIRDLLPRSTEPTIVSLATECDEIIGAFIRGQLLVMLALGVIYSIGLWFVGLDLALILGLIAGLASIVPYMGFIVGIVAAGIACWFQFQELMPLLAVAAVFGVGQLLEGMVLTPSLVGDRIGLHPVAVIFAIMAGGQIAGFSGVLLALPVAAVIMVLLRFIHRNYKASDLYSAQ